MRSESARRRRETRSDRIRLSDADAAGCRTTGQSMDGSGRHAHPALHVLPRGADASIRDRPDAAGGRRLDHRRNRQRVPGAGGDHGAADQPRQAKHQGFRRAFSLPTSRTRRSGCAAVLHVLYLIFNEGYTSSDGAEFATAGAIRRGDSAGARRSQAAAGRCRGRGIAGAHAADRRAPRGANRTGRRVDTADASRIERCGIRGKLPRASR